jgi:hypothetical protein
MDLPGMIQRAIVDAGLSPGAASPLAWLWLHYRGFCQHVSDAAADGQLAERLSSQLEALWLLGFFTLYGGQGQLNRHWLDGQLAQVFDLLRQGLKQPWLLKVRVLDG